MNFFSCFLLAYTQVNSENKLLQKIHVKCMPIISNTG